MKRAFSALSLLCLLACPLWAAPPVVKLPAEIKGDPGTFITVKPTEVTGNSTVKYVALDSGLSVFPGELLTDKTATVLVALKSGRYRLLAYTGNADGPSDPSVSVIVVGEAPIGVPPTDPPKDPPKDPPVVPGKKHYMIVRAGGVGIPKEFEAIMQMQGWSDVKKAGHTVADFPYTSLSPEAKRLLLDNGVERPLPFVAVWDYTPDGNSMILPIGNNTKPFPTTDEAIRGLLK